jgi:hypothetical protein
VRIENLKASLSLESMSRPRGIVFHSRENPSEDSQDGPEAIERISGLSVPFAFPWDATPSVVRFFQDRGSQLPFVLKHPWSYAPLHEPLLTGGPLRAKQIYLPAPGGHQSHPNC